MARRVPGQGRSGSLCEWVWLVEAEAVGHGQHVEGDVPAGDMPVGVSPVGLPLNNWLAADDRSNHEHLETLRSRAGRGRDNSVLRVFDVLTWMTGKGYANT